MFAQLAPLVAERNIHLLISAGTHGQLSVYIEPCQKDDKEDVAFVTPFRAVATPQELDEQFSTILDQWVASRQKSNASLSEALAVAEASQKTAADAAKKALADKGKKPPSSVTSSGKPTVKTETKPVTPSLLDSVTTSVASGSTAVAQAAPSPAPETPVSVAVSTATENTAAPTVAPVSQAIAAAVGPTASAESTAPAPIINNSSVFAETSAPQLF